MEQDLELVRDEIDSIDQQLVELLTCRQKLVERAGVLKRGQSTEAVRAPDRVAQVIAARRDAATAAGLDPDVAEHVWSAMIQAFTSLELRVHEQ